MILLHQLCRKCWHILDNEISDLETLNKTNLSNGTNIEMARTDLIAKIGENISIRRFDKINNVTIWVYTLMVQR